MYVSLFFRDGNRIVGIEIYYQTDDETGNKIVKDIFLNDSIFTTDVRVLTSKDSCFLDDLKTKFSQQFM